eukprot:TRINITY_DN45557_c0_g1_i1.p1 TRINITY_DN45557_c0_g1~~TRINITY_DN45557_c0_g1_i1.p1  ORF type:complete len:147 (-),score=37.47 TRINITY_DN45557_c0_g1_i1:41-442(-)
MARRMVVTLIFMLTVQTYIMLEEDIPTAQLRVGLLCSCLTVVYCSAPLASLQHVCRTQSTASLPFYLIMATAAVTAQWSLYGVIIQDAVVLLPNLLGCVVACAQLGLFCFFPHNDGAKQYAVLETETQDGNNA